MTYNVYKDDELIAEGIEGKEYSVEGLNPNTEYSFSVSKIAEGKESEKATVTMKTKPVEVTGVTVSPKTSTAEAGVSANRQLSASVEPNDATNKSLSYNIAPITSGLTVNAEGLITWTDAVPSGVYTTTIKTADGNKTATHALTLTEPIIPDVGDA